MTENYRAMLIYIFPASVFPVNEKPDPLHG